MADRQLHMLTTIDNPFHPGSQYKEWSEYDESHGYFTAPYLARIVLTSDSLSDDDQDLAIERAIDEIIQENILGIYIKVPAESEIVSPAE